MARNAAASRRGRGRQQDEHAWAVPATLSSTNGPIGPLFPAAHGRPPWLELQSSNRPGWGRRSVTMSGTVSFLTFTALEAPWEAGLSPFNC
jgi:hypothetical protein